MAALLKHRKGHFAFYSSRYLDKNTANEYLPKQVGAVAEPEGLQPPPIGPKEKTRGLLER